MADDKTLEITRRSAKTSEDFPKVTKVLLIRKAKSSKITNCIPKSCDLGDSHLSL